MGSQTRAALQRKLLVIHVSHRPGQNSSSCGKLQSGYREGLDQGKEQTLQQGFESGMLGTTRHSSTKISLHFCVRLVQLSTVASLIRFHTRVCSWVRVGTAARCHQHAESLCWAVSRHQHPTGTVFLESFTLAERVISNSLQTCCRLLV